MNPAVSPAWTAVLAACGERVKDVLNEQFQEHDGRVSARGPLHLLLSAGRTLSLFGETSTERVLCEESASFSPRFAVAGVSERPGWVVASLMNELAHMTNPELVILLATSLLDQLGVAAGIEIEFDTTSMAFISYGCDPWAGQAAS